MTTALDVEERLPNPNPEQEQVLAHLGGPIRIMAGAGTGKTFTLTERVVRLISDGAIQPHQILVLSFNNKSAAELGERIGKACLSMGVSPDAEPVTVLTYHSFGSSVLREWGGMIGLPPSLTLLSAADQWLLLWDCLPRIDFRTINLMALRAPHNSPLQFILNLSSRLKDELATPGQLLEYVQGAGALELEDPDRVADYARALLVYEAERTARGAVAYGDQIALAVQALRLPEVRASYGERFRSVLVDEYQDTNYAQSIMVQLLMQDWSQRNICVVGDIRQAIYRFRGAAPDNLRRFTSDFTETTHYSLRRNYRSTEQILAVANAVWQGVSDDDSEDLIAAGGRRGADVVSCVCEDSETEWEWIARRIQEHRAAGVAYRDMAVLARKNEIKRQVWRALLDRGIPAVMTGGADLFAAPEVRELLSYVRALARPSDSISLAHIASSDSFGLDEAALYDLLGPLPHGQSLFDTLADRAADPAAPPNLRVFLHTFSGLLTTAATTSPARVVERIIGLRRGAYSDLQRANVYRFHGIAQSFGEGGIGAATLGNFVAYVNLLLSAPSDEEEATEPVGEDAIQLCTVHAAKGLERRVVFVAGASQQDFTLPDNADPLPPALRHPAAGMPVPEEFPDSKKYTRALKKWSKQEHDLEEQRIAYVALTRAQDQLYISWHRLPLQRGKERSPLDTLQHALPLTRRETFDRDAWYVEPEPETAIDMRALAQRFAHMQSRAWAGWSPEDFGDGPAAMAERLATAWREMLREAGVPDGREDVLEAGMRRWYGERERVQGLLQRCLTPAMRPADADRRPVIEAPSTVSYTMLDTYRKCSRRAWLRFVAGFPGEPQSRTTGPGTAFHAAMETAAAAKQTGRDLTLDELTEAYRESAAEALGVDHHDLTEDDRRMLRSFYTGPDREAAPMFIEAEFYWRVGPGYIHGFIDRIQRCPDGSIELIDFKTYGKAANETEVREELQLLIYALASREVYNLPLDRVTLVYPRLDQRVSVRCTDDELHRARKGIVDLMESARTAGYDRYNTEHCRWCEYRLICPAARTGG